MIIGMSNRITRTMEDYLEAVYRINQRKGFVRTKDIALELRVSSPSVTEMLQKLSNQKLVKYQPYCPVALTREGEKKARIIAKRHETLTKLLKIVFISDRIAEEDACKIEHQLPPESIKQLSKLVELVETAPAYPRWLEHFKQFCATGEYDCQHQKN